jgi:hypothetical protein
MKRLAFLPVALVLSGCAEHWVKPGATAADFDAAETRCRAQSYAMLPPVMQRVMVSPASRTPVRTRCSGSGNSSNCTTTGGDYRPAVYRNDDINQAGRREMRRACLYQDGWRPAAD